MHYYLNLNSNQLLVDNNLVYPFDASHDAKNSKFQLNFFPEGFPRVFPHIHLATNRHLYIEVIQTLNLKISIKAGYVAANRQPHK